MKIISKTVEQENTEQIFKGIYNYKGKEYKYKEKNLEYQEGVIELKRKIDKHESEFTFESKMQMHKYSKNTDSGEYKYWLDEYLSDKEYANNKFFTNPDNIKYVLEKLLETDLTGLQFINLTTEESEELTLFTKEVLNNFFYTAKGKKKQSD